MLNEELQDELVQEVEQVEEVVEESAEVEAEESQEETEADEVVVTIGDEPQPEEEEAKAAPQWVRDLRKADREKTKRIRELEAEVERSKPKAELPALGKEPEIGDDGIDYDGDVFKQKYAEWFARKQKIEAAERDKKREEEEKQKEWQTKLDAYATSKESLRVKDYEDAEEVILGTLAEQQQAIIVAYAENPALVVYALGKNPKKAQELSAIKDPVKFAIHVSKLESQLKVQSRKPATQPERVPSGTAPKSGAIDNQLERLRAEAEKTGNYTKVTEYKRRQKENAK